jgi:hypothetical protein
MSTDRSGERQPSDIAAQQALSAFEEALDLLDAYQGDGFDGTTTLPALPLASLLEQCETILDAQSAATGPLSVLFALPGVPALEPEWWAARFSGLAVRRLGAADLNDAGFHAWSEACRAKGSPLLLTATPQITLPAGVTPDAMAFVVCHPYRSFQALPRDAAITLGAYCAEVLRALEKMPGLETIQIETLEDVPIRLRSALELPASVTALFTSGDGMDQSVLLPPYFEGGEAYNSLCTQLGYRDATLPVLSGDAGPVQVPVYRMQHGTKRAATPALISKFLARAARVRQRFDPSCGLFDTSAIAALLDSCVAAQDEGFLDLFDQGVDQLAQIDGAVAYLAAAAHFEAIGDRLSGLNFVGNALLLAPPDIYWIRVLAAAAYTDLNDAKSALLVLVSGALEPGVLEDVTREKLDATVSGMIMVKQNEHGHALLMDALEKDPPASSGRRRVLIEIGTTRELVLGQGSTQKLAMLCAEYDLDFITVDMDPRNTRNAARMFARAGYDFKAVTAKGEDFLAQYDGMIDYIFLDAYDFDHGNHSEIRQDRYEKFLGSRIVEEQCHQMHLECAETLVTKLAPDGLICFDDTWTSSEGAWTAKGTTAMPYLLEHGFEVIEARNNAALLRWTNR